MQLKPGEQFVIVRQLDNPADSATYYVQAVIRNSKTDATIATVNLDDKGNQRFTKAWQVVPDPSGEGLYIDIESRVYTDSGHTTYSDVYAKENHVYLVLERAFPQGAPGINTPEVNYKRIGDMIKSAVGKKEKPSDKKIDFSDILRRIDDLGTAISSLKDPEKVDLTPITSALAEIARGMEQNHTEMGGKVDNKEVTPPTDLAPLLERFDAIDPSGLLDMMKKIMENVHTYLGGDLTKILSGIDELKQTVNDTPYLPIYTRSKEEIKKDNSAPARKRNL